MNNQLFNLEKIKELTFPIEDLQAKINELMEFSKIIENNKRSLIQNFTNKKFLAQVEELTEILHDINVMLAKISKNNINKFLALQDKLIQKYKAIFQENLKKLKLNKDNIKNIGLFLIENKKLSKIIDKVSYIPSIGISQWLEILEVLNQNSLFLRTVKKIEIYYQDKIKDKLKAELDRIPDDTNASIITDYEKAFQEDPALTFREFLQDIDNKLTFQELQVKKEIIKKAKEKEELEKLKMKQEEQKKAYEDYLKLSDREFERKMRKKSREKLTRITSGAKEKKKLEISDEVTEKIEKFKSQFEKKLEERYLIQEDEEKDPIDLVRERKKKKEKEYKKFKDHFKSI